MRRASVYLLGVCSLVSFTSGIQADERAKLGLSLAECLAALDRDGDDAIDVGELRDCLENVKSSFDVNHDGRLSRSERAELLESVKTRLEEQAPHATAVVREEVERLARTGRELVARLPAELDGADANDNGELSCDEIRSALKSQVRSTKAHLRDHGRKAQANLDREARHWMERLSTRSAAQSIKKQFSGDCAAGTTKAELQTALDLTFGIADRNRDGALTDDEFATALRTVASVACRRIEADFHQLFRSVGSR